MKFKWEGKTKRRWQIWDGFKDLIALCESVDGRNVNKQWLLDELETVGELGLSHKFIQLYNSGRKYENPNSSSLAWFLAITDHEPTSPPRGMKMSQGRLTAPDIDLDFDDRYRQDVMEYARQKYGHEKCAQIVTFGTIGAKKAVRDVARVMGYPYELGDRISKAMPPAVFGVAPSLDKCLTHPEFIKLYEEDEDVRQIVDSAKTLEGLWRERGVHAAALVIADRPISDYVPTGKYSEDGPVCTQWEMERSEKCGLLKIDFLALRNLSIIDRCVKLVKENRDIEVGDVYKLPEQEDPEVYKLMQKGYNVGIFQMESDGFRDLMLDVQPTGMNDIGAMLALYRPGPMGSNVHREYAARKRGDKASRVPHEKLQPILGDTYSLLLYQDQLLRIVKEVADKDTMEADEFRKIVGKKIVELMPGQRKAFVEGCVDNGIPESIAVHLFNEIEHHAAYSFNAAHSFAYAMISYITAYLKAYYPIEYMTAALSSLNSAKTEDQDRARVYLNECKILNIDVKGPSINRADRQWTITDNTINFGFESINGFGGASVETVLKSRQQSGKVNNFYEFFRRANSDVLTRNILLHLLNSGALDEILVLDEFSEELTRNDRIQLLFAESKELGVFLAQHPFLDLADLVMDKASHKISDITPTLVDPYVKIAGIITKVTKKTTKAGKRMFILEIEDDRKGIEVIVFPQSAEKLADEKPFKISDLIVIGGKPKIEGEDEDTLKVSLIYNESETIDYSDVSSERPIILHSKKPLDHDRISKISDIIDSTNGSSTVILDMPLRAGGKITVKFEKTVSPKVEGVLNKLIEV